MQPTSPLDSPPLRTTSLRSAADSLLSDDQDESKGALFFKPRSSPRASQEDATPTASRIQGVPGTTAAAVDSPTTIRQPRAAGAKRSALPAGYQDAEAGSSYSSDSADSQGDEEARLSERRQGKRRQRERKRSAASSLSSRGGAALASATHSVVDLTLGATAAERERRRAFWRAAVINLALIASWYLFSTIMNLYNSWLFSKKRYGFSYPLFVTSMHMIVQFALSSAALALFKDIAPRGRNGKRARPNAKDWLSKVVPCALATAIDIGLSNLSLKTITLTFYTMCKSSNLAFVLLFAFIFRLEVVRLSLIGIIGLITIGVIMMVAAETKFVLEGAVEVLSASAMGGLRWALTQILLDREGMGMNNPIATIFWLAPVMFVGMMSVSLLVEDWHAMLTSKFFDGAPRALKTMALAVAPGCIAFLMNLSEFALIQRTSVVTLSVAGIFKEVSTILLSSSVFGDELTPINVTGLCIALLGIALYNYLKYRLLMSGATVTPSQGASPGYEALSTTSGGAGVGGSADWQGVRSATAEREANAEEEGSLAMSERDEAPLSEAELERRRKRNEEADMDGAGVWSTGQGFYEEDESDEDDGRRR